MTRHFWDAAFVCASLCLLPSVLLAQTNSGPSTGSKIEPLKVFAVTGDDEGREVDYAAQRADKPTFFVFVQADKWDRPLARFLKVLDQEVSKDRPEVAIVAVWLTDDVEKTKEYLPKAQDSVKFSQAVLAVYPGDKNGPAGWSINTGAHLTVIVAHENRALASFGFRSVNDLDVPTVLAKLPPKK